MKRSPIFYLIISIFLLIVPAAFVGFKDSAENAVNYNNVGSGQRRPQQYNFPSFYRGIYLSNDSAYSLNRFRKFLDTAVKSHINTLVMDVQTSKYKERMIPVEHVTQCLNLKVHPIARIVVFPGGLSNYPPSEKYLTYIVDIAVRAAKAGFREIQFDYIRFSDENRHAERLKHVNLEERHNFIKKFLSQAKIRLSSYNIRVAADIFGRVPHNINDPIGQKMEVFDEQVDVICPMAYPSHYWTKKLRHDPYGTVLWTSTEADRRTEKAEIVTWIQAFRMQHPPDMLFEDYITHQIKAVYDANVRGFLLWNARQEYSHALKAVSKFYKSQNDTGKNAL